LSEIETKKIKFVANRPWLTEESSSAPGSTIKAIPEWYRKADRFAVNPMTNEHWKSPADGGKIPTWKACPAIFDIMGTGYVYKTPCDIEFYEEAGQIKVRILDQQSSDFIQIRPPMPQFVPPMGYHESHFAWWSDWAVEVPEGYSVLYTQPFNRFDLPFLTTSGIIDNDKVHLPGTMPFFVVKGFTGLIPAGTPYAQMLPFKRENWESETISNIPYEEMALKNQKNSEKYRVPDGGVYQKEVWTRRTYI
jgi:hypothetical protein